MTHRIAVIGVGRIGVVTAIGLAHLGHEVVGIDRRLARVTMLQAGELREAEPGLRAALESARRYRSLRFSQELEARGFEFVFLCVDSPGGEDGAPDLSQVLDATRDAARIMVHGGILVTRSTIPVGTGDRLEAALAAEGRDDIRVVHMPEFLREGRAWEDFREPDRVVLGGDDCEAVARAAELFASLNAPTFTTSRRTAEFAKYAANAFLATSISFANEVSDLCASAGAVPGEVFDILRADRRIGPHAYLRPGLGFGGHCLPKDTDALQHLGGAHGLAMPQLQATRTVNRLRGGQAAAWLRRELGTLNGKTVCLAGLAFKPGTDDLRELPAFRLAALLRGDGAIVTGWDPMVREAIAGVQTYESFEHAIADADALVIATLPESLELTPQFVRALMHGNVILDPSHVLEKEQWADSGFVISSIASSLAAATQGAP